MFHEIIKLTDIYPKLPKTSTEVVLKSYARDKNESVRRRKRAAVLILHGGAYAVKAINEYEPVALRYMAEGIQAFTLDYSLLPSRYPQQLLEAACAVDYIRKNSDRYLIDPDKIILCGFSAGSHLALMLGNKWNEEELSRALSLRPSDIRPDGMILSYPPTDEKTDGVDGFFEGLIENDRNQVSDISPLGTVVKDTPPSFIWHSLTDTMVPVQNSIHLAERLSDMNIPFELHIFPTGQHACALADEECAFMPEALNPHVAKWFGMSLTWLKDTFDV